MVLGYIVIFVSGFMLMRGGKPYSVLITTIHKLVSVGLIVFMVFTVIKIHHAVALTSIDLLILAVVAISFIGLLATGGLLATDKDMPPIVHLLHKILPYLTVISTVIFIFTQLRKK